jgi:membrane-bound serine protease (ClpP class)
MAGTIALILVLLLAALLLFAAEICTPTFGVLGVAGLACLAGMVYLCFSINPLLGIVVVVGLIFLIPTYLYLMVKYLPRTPLGRILQLRTRTAEPGEGTPVADAEESLIGRTAVAETILRPSGAIRIDGRRVHATAETGFIAKGAKVKVVGTVGMNVVVREVQQPSA